MSMFETASERPDLVYFFTASSDYWSIAYKQEDGTYCGKLEGLMRDTVEWKAEYLGIETAIQNAIDSYLIECEEQGVMPDTPVEWKEF